MPTVCITPFYNQRIPHWKVTLEQSLTSVAPVKKDIYDVSLSSDLGSFVTVELFTCKDPSDLAYLTGKNLHTKMSVRKCKNVYRSLDKMQTNSRQITGINMHVTTASTQRVCGDGCSVIGFTMSLDNCHGVYKTQLRPYLYNARCRLPFSTATMLASLMLVIHPFEIYRRAS